MRDVYTGFNYLTSCIVNKLTLGYEEKHQFGNYSRVKRNHLLTLLNHSTDMQSFIYLINNLDVIYNEQLFMVFLKQESCGDDCDICLDCALDDCLTADFEVCNSRIRELVSLYKLGFDITIYIQKEQPKYIRFPVVGDGVKQFYNNSIRSREFVTKNSTVVNKICYGDKVDDFVRVGFKSKNDEVKPDINVENIDGYNVVKTDAFKGHKDEGHVQQNNRNKGGYKGNDRQQNNDNFRNNQRNDDYSNNNGGRGNYKNNSNRGYSNRGSNNNRGYNNQRGGRGGGSRGRGNYNDRSDDYTDFNHVNYTHTSGRSRGNANSFTKGNNRGNYNNRGNEVNRGKINYTHTNSG